MYAPLGSSWALLSTTLSPNPIMNVPLTTTTPASIGWKCGGILYPEGILRATAYIAPACDGFPCRPANCAPAGSDGAAGCHGIWSGFTSTCPGDFESLAGWPKQTLAASTAIASVILRLFIGSAFTGFCRFDRTP